MQMPANRMLVHFNDIVTTARKNNPKLGVCGFLMFDQFRFYQVLEGEEKSVKKLYEIISSDLRHTDMELLMDVPIEQTHFEDWSMASFLSSTTSHPLKTKHGIEINSEISGEAFMQFAVDFVALDPEKADAD
jgi:Sensors of blue-light using FAD